MKTETIHRRSEKKTTVAIRPSTHKKLKRRALDLDTGVSHLAEQFITDGLKQPLSKQRAVA